MGHWNKEQRQQRGKNEEKFFRQLAAYAFAAIVHLFVDYNHNIIQFIHEIFIRCIAIVQNDD